MKTIKAIVFGTLIAVATVSAGALFLCMCATEVSNLVDFIKWFMTSALTFGASALLIKSLYERWYKR
mgnify:CR=1 FL=1